MNKKNERNHRQLELFKLDSLAKKIKTFKPERNASTFHRRRSLTQTYESVGFETLGDAFDAMDDYYRQATVSERGSK